MRACNYACISIRVNEHMAAILRLVPCHSVLRRVAPGHVVAQGCVALYIGSLNLLRILVHRLVVCRFKVHSSPIITVRCIHALCHSCIPSRLPTRSVIEPHSAFNSQFNRFGVILVNILIQDWITVLLVQD